MVDVDLDVFGNDRQVVLVEVVVAVPRHHFFEVGQLIRKQHLAVKAGPAESRVTSGGPLHEEGEEYGASTLGEGTTGHQQQLDGPLGDDLGRQTRCRGQVEVIVGIDGLDVGVREARPVPLELLVVYEHDSVETDVQPVLNLHDGPGFGVPADLRVKEVLGDAEFLQLGPNSRRDCSCWRWTEGFGARPRCGSDRQSHSSRRHRHLH